MAKQKVKLNFIKFDIPSKIQFSRDRVGDMDTPGGSFTSPDVPYATMTAATDDLETKHQAAQGGNENDTIEQNKAQEILDDLLRKQAAFVDRIADGDAAVITEGGWSFTDVEPTLKPAPEKPENHKLDRGEEIATIESVIDTLKDSVAFITIAKSDPSITVEFINSQMRINFADGKHIIIHAGTNKKVLLTNLERGTMYNIYKYGINAAGKGPNSDTEEIIAP